MKKIVKFSYISDKILLERKKVILDELKNHNILNNTLSLNPNYITGFMDGEGSFHIHSTQHKTSKFKFMLVPTVTIKQSIYSPDILYEIQTFFKCGRVTQAPLIKNKLGTSRCLVYTCNSLKDINEKIIPHFLKYPLKTSKLNDFLIFNKICQKLSNKENYTIQTLLECVDLFYCMNQNGKFRKRSRLDLYKHVLKLNGESINFLKDEGIV
uniref:LAGLIDADG DNA endonuclease n=1 Tax=Prototheca wickerhamii TaxID=3111 RepID=A0A873HVT6_PROWI|nr:LAGLIDADG DNA endonuclease [Prototheca wickerhamii]